MDVTLVICVWAFGAPIPVANVWVGIVLPAVKKRLTANISFCAVLSALCVVLMMLCRVISITDYAISALCGIVIGIIVVECGKKWAIAAYAVISLLGLLLGSNECAITFVIFLGYYPIIKASIEKVKNRGVQYLLKFLVFNTSIVLFYAVLAKLFLMPQISDFGKFGKYSVVLFLLLGNITFYLYDIVLVKAANLYILKIHPKIQKIRIK